MFDRVRQVVWWAVGILIVSACGLAVIAKGLSIPGVPKSFLLPLLLICGGLSAAIVAFGVLDWIFGGTVHRLGPGRCLHCGYDLRHTPDRCPECGMPPDPQPTDPTD